MKHAALLMIDLQNDFCHGGSLEVPDADSIISITNQLQDCFEMVIASKDWHPADHLSFASNHVDARVGDYVNLDGVNQCLWPDHCVQETRGADFHPKLNTLKIAKIIYKGSNRGVDSYSAFFDNQQLLATELAAFLRDTSIKTLYINGLATEYCVKYSALDALSLGFEVYLIHDACRGLDNTAINIAIQEMQNKGIKIINSESILNNSMILST